MNRKNFVISILAAMCCIATCAGVPSAGHAQTDPRITKSMESVKAITAKLGAPEILRLSASYVDRILRGARPNDLPVQKPTKFIHSDDWAKSFRGNISIFARPRFCHSFIC